MKIGPYLLLSTTALLVASTSVYCIAPDLTRYALHCELLFEAPIVLRYIHSELLMDVARCIDLLECVWRPAESGENLASVTSM